MNINISTSKVISNHQCISCLLCTDEMACPVDNTLNFSVLGKKNSRENSEKDSRGKNKEKNLGGRGKK